MIRRPPRSTLSSSSAASDVYKRQPCYRKILCIDCNRLIVHSSGSNDNTITMQYFFLHVEITACVFNKKIVLVKRILVQNSFYPFTGSFLAHGHLLLDGFFATSLLGLLFSFPEVKDVSLK